MKKAFLFCMLLAAAPANAADKDCTLIVDYLHNNKIVKQDGDCESAYTPASTFKIALALIGFDRGILKNAHEPAWEFKEGYTVNKPNDRETTDPMRWEKESVVWYSQKLTTILGMDEFYDYVGMLDYGNQDLSGGLTKAWLGTSLKISPKQQVEFLSNMLGRQYNLSAKAYEMTERIIPEFKTKNGWVVKGKTGSSGLEGWFVGWATKDERHMIFAKHILLKDAKQKPGGPVAREMLLKDFESVK